MKKGCLTAIAISIGLLVATAVGIYFHFKNKYDPFHHGRRIYTWADQAVWDDSAAKRQEAVQVLFEALEGMEGEPRTQLLLYFVAPTRGDEKKATMPQELLPFFIQAMKVEHRSGYPAKALRKIPGENTVLALVDLLRSDPSENVREQAAQLLGGLGSEKKLGQAKEKALAGLHEALQDENEHVRKSAEQSLKWIK
jgi:HEAT repeat protein